MFSHTCQCCVLQVGLNAYAQQTDLPYSDTSLEGYLGIAVKNFSGNVDCMQFIRSDPLNAADGRSAGVGNPAAGGSWTELRCLEESKMIGMSS
jgi:hypothetical protein